MAYLIGTDEAGYGPNLGPLVVSATLWELPNQRLGADLYPYLDQVIRPFEAADASRQIVVADSKRLYKPAGGMGALERGVLAMLGTLPRAVATWRDAWSTLDAGSVQWLDRLPWYRDYDRPLPLECPADEIQPLSERIRGVSQAQEIRCQHIESATVFPQRLNELIRQHGNKASALSVVTLSLVRRLLEGLGDQPILVQCDKHGGRAKYHPLLQQIVTDHLVEIRQEGRQESIYRFGPPRRRVEIRFTAKGERCLATALASMTSKYLRELAMEAFNDFWCRHAPGLRRTAGYPVDARRFKDEIQPIQEQLDIRDELLWRNR